MSVSSFSFVRGILELVRIFGIHKRFLNLQMSLLVILQFLFSFCCFSFSLTNVSDEFTIFPRIRKRSRRVCTIVISVSYASFFFNHYDYCKPT